MSRETDHLTIGEWSRWREDDRRWKDQLDDRLDQQGIAIKKNEADIILVGNTNAKAAGKNSALSALVSALMSGVIGAFK